MLERVLETFAPHRASDTHALSGFDAQTIRGKELGGACTPTQRVEHPRVFLRHIFHGHLLANVSLRTRDSGGRDVRRLLTEPSANSQMLWARSELQALGHSLALVRYPGSVRTDRLFGST